MNKKDTDKMIQALIPAIEKAVKQTVNGKIDRLTRTLDDHIAELKPVSDGWKTIQGVKSGIVWLAGLLLSIGAIVAFFKQL